MESQILNAAQEEVSGWFYIEIFGHTVVCGRVTTKKLGVAVMFQVDVPKGEADFSHSQLLNPSSVFSMTPTTEEYCRKFNTARERNNYNVLPYIPPERLLGKGPEGQEDLFDNPYEDQIGE